MVQTSNNVYFEDKNKEKENFGEFTIPKLADTRWRKWIHFCHGMMQKLKHLHVMM